MLSHLFYPMYEDIHSPKNTKGADYCAQTENIITSILPRPGQAAGSARLWEVQAEGRYEARLHTRCSQAVRSLGPLSSACYQAYAHGLSTRWSPWDLNSLAAEPVGRLILEPASRLDAFSAYPFWT
jgi:hypothetical protein